MCVILVAGKRRNILGNIIFLYSVGCVWDRQRNNCCCACHAHRSPPRLGCFQHAPSLDQPPHVLYVVHGARSTEKPPYSVLLPLYEAPSCGTTQRPDPLARLSSIYWASGVDRVYLVFSGRFRAEEPAPSLRCHGIQLQYIVYQVHVSGKKTQETNEGISLNGLEVRAWSPTPAVP